MSFRRALEPYQIECSRPRGDRWSTFHSILVFITLFTRKPATTRIWLRSYTKMPELMEQAVAATRWASEGMGTDFLQNSYHHREPESVAAPRQEHTRTTEGGDSYSPVNSLFPSCRSRSPSPRSAYSSDYEGSEDEDDPDLLSMTEDADGWYGYARPIGGGVRDPGEEPDYESETDDDEPLENGQSHRRIRDHTRRALFFLLTTLHTTPSPPPSHPEEKEHEPTTTTATA
ncbi:hypothetical protein EV424DRAFT_1542253 [Suillus variegatus]|nr:hypothetical protein EV424DRAFT_1542253 [Suillus variegatus]